MRFLFLTLAAALALPAAHAAAPKAEPATPLESIPGGPPPTPRLPAGASQGEILAAKQFGWLDLDRDGVLTREEVALFPRLRDAFDEADQNRDNRVSFEEIRALALQRRAEKADENQPAAPGASAPAAKARPAKPSKPS